MAQMTDGNPKPLTPAMHNWAASQATVFVANLKVVFHPLLIGPARKVSSALLALHSNGALRPDVQLRASCLYIMNLS